MMLAVPVIILIAVCCGGGAEHAPAPAPTVSPGLLAALQADKFTVPVPASLLADRPALVSQLETFVDGPTGELGSERAVLRRRAVIYLGVYGGAAAVPTLRRLVANENEEYRRDAVIGLGQTGTAEGVEVATAFLVHPDELFREAAIDGLGHSGRKDGLDALRAFDATRDRAFIRQKREAAIQKLERTTTSRPADEPTSRGSVAD